MTPTTEEPHYAIDGVNGGELTCQAGKVRLDEVDGFRCIDCFNANVCADGACLEGHQGATCGQCEQGWFWCVGAFERHRFRSPPAAPPP